MQFRKHQTECLQTIRDNWSDSTILIQAPCAFGKTFVFSYIANEIKKMRVLILVNKIKLAKQTTKYLDSYGMVCASLNEKNYSERITIASIGSIKKYDYDLIIVDEVHDFTEKTLKKFTYKKMIGFTATPFKGTGELIYGEDKIFKKLHYKKTSKELTQEGWQVPVILKDSKDKFDTSKIKKRKDDYVTKELNNFIMSDKAKIKDQVEDAVKRSSSRNKIAFICCNIEHAELVFESLPDKKAITHSNRNEGLSEFENGDYRYLVSVMQVTTGYDFPALDCLVMMRPTRSPVLYIQAVGRIQRTHPSKTDALFLDYGGVVEALGMIYDVSPTHKPSIKICPDCERYQPTSVSICECGWQFISRCNICGELKKIGESCCVIKRENNYLKNLTDEAFEKLRWHEVIAINYSKHISKIGNECVKITYILGFTKSVTDYKVVRSGSYEQELKKIKEKPRPKRVVVDKVNGYDKVVAWI